MSNLKSGIPMNKIQDYLGTTMIADLKNKHQIKGTLAFYHLNEQMIHLVDWSEFDQNQNLIRRGNYIILNRTSWYSFHT